MRLLVTGASGFLGRYLVAAAAAVGHEVFALSRRPSLELEKFSKELILCDIIKVSEADLPRGLDAVIHFATGNDG